MAENNANDPPTTPQPDGNTQNTGPESQVSNNRYSVSIWGIVLCGIIGFVAGVYILLGWPGNHKNRFHEIDLDLHTVNSDGLAKLDTLLKKKRDEILLMPEIPDAIKKTKIKKLDSINGLIKNLNKARFDLNYGNADTVPFNAINYSMRRGKLASMITTYKVPQGADIELLYHNPTFSDSQFVLKNHVSQKEYSTTAFFRKYPSFAFWAFLWLLQIVMWFLMLPICIYLLSKIKELNIESGTQNRRGKSFLIAGISLAIFCVVFYEGITQEYFVVDEYFMRGFQMNLKIYSFIGYIIAFFCLSGYLYIADFLHQLQNKFKAGIDALNKLKDEKMKNIQVTDPPVDIMQIPEVKQKDAENEKIKEQFKRAKKYFNLFFGMTAIVLSVLVLCAASMFNSVNSLDIFSFYEHLSSRKYLSGDFVYLYGGVHTILLIIFVLPARFKIYDLNTSIPELQETDEAGKTATGVLKNIGKVIGEVLVVSSPLLASFLQNVINSFFN